MWSTQQEETPTPAIRPSVQDDQVREAKCWMDWKY